MATVSDSLSPEYVTLKGMLGDLVDKLAASATVIPQLNGHLLSSDLIPEAAFNAVQHPGPRATPYDRCYDMLTPVLAIVKSNPACFYLLIESLKTVKLYDIAFKLVEKLESKQNLREKDSDYEVDTTSESSTSDDDDDDDEEYMESSSAISSISDDEVSYSIPFPYVHTPPTLTYAMIDKMMERGGSFSDKAMSMEQKDNNDTQSSASALQQFSKHFSYVKGFLKRKSIEVNEGPKRRTDSFSLGKASHDDLIGNFQKGRYQLALTSLRSCTDSKYLKSVTSSEKHYKANLLHWAARWGWIDIINKLIDDHGFDPMSTDAGGRTAVHYAVFGRQFKAFELLIAKHRCNPIFEDSERQSPLFFSMERGCFDIIKYYMTTLGYDGNTTCKGEPLGIIAVEHGHLEILKYLKEKCNFGVKKSFFEEDKLSKALDYAARFGHLGIVKYLTVECKCDPNKKWGEIKPLHHASKNGHINIVEYLVSKCNCNVHEAAEGLSPLQHAAENRHFKLVKHFIEKFHCDADPALQHCGSLEILKYLSEKCGKNPDYNILIDKAIKHKHADVVKYLVAQWGKDTDLTNRLSEATRHQNFQTVDFLINECHANPTSIDSNGRTLLHHAAECLSTMNGLLLIQCLLAAGLDPLKKDEKGDTSLAIARRNKYFKWNEIRKFFDAFGKTKTMYPVDSYVNVLIVGNSGAGKSTLSKVIEKTTDGSYILFQESRYVDPSEVKPLTAGIVPIEIRHKQLKNIVLHDFAGQSQYYLSHTSVIENALLGSAAVFIIVVDVSNSDHLIHLKQWLAVVRNEIQKAKDDCKVIVVASHIDCFDSDVEKEKTIGKLNLEISEGDDIEYLDCRKLGGERLDSFFLKLQNACSYIREKNKKSLTLYCHMMYNLLQNSEKEILTLHDIVSEQMNKYDRFFLPFDGKQILSILSSLHSTGLIYYLNCDDDFEFHFNLKVLYDHIEVSSRASDSCKVWVVKNKMKFLKDINGIIFSPETFKEHPNIAKNGIITIPFLKSLFPSDDLIMIVSFLESMGLCHIVSPLFLLQTNLLEEKDEINAEDTHCLFFPSLVDFPRPTNYDSFCFGWFLECTVHHQYFSQRFFNSLVLHLTLKHLPKATHDICQHEYWKNGVKWGYENGVVASMELVNHNRFVLILMSCNEESEYNSMISLRQNIIRDILTLREQYCPTLKVEDLVIDPDCLKSYPIENPRETTAYCVKSMRALRDMKKRSYIFPKYPTTTIKGKPLCDILPNEPDYDNLSIFGEAKLYCGSRTTHIRHDNREKEFNTNSIANTLRLHHFPDRYWKKLGHHLGLDDSTLDDIDQQYGTLRERFEKCLHTWLKREDTNKQTKSWRTIVEALNKMNQRGVAKSIRSETLPAHYH